MFRPVPREELYRKLLHVLVILLPVGVFYGPAIFSTDRQTIVFFTLFILLLSFAIEIARFRNTAFAKWYFDTFGSMLREEEKNKLTGATYVAAATFFCAWLSLVDERMAASACMGLILFILGDAAAALVGKSMGRIRIGEKTLEGALGCFLSCLGLCFYAIPQLPDFISKWGGAVELWQALVISILVAFLELFPVQLGKIKLNDNLYVPVLVTLGAYLLD